MGLFVAFAILLLVALGLTTGATIKTAAVATRTGNSNNDTGVVVSKSDQSLTGSYITEDITTWPGATESFPSDKIWNICAAVAQAEGFNRGQGTAPYDLNNPGDLSPGDEAGESNSGSEFHDGSHIIVFNVVEGGFRALYRKFERIVNGASSVYPQSWTWTQVSQKYAGNSANWVKNVTDYLGVDPSSTPSQYVNS